MGRKYRLIGPNIETEIVDVATGNSLEDLTEANDASGLNQAQVDARVVAVGGALYPTDAEMAAAIAAAIGALPPGGGSVLVNTTLFVDAVNGNDATAVKGDMTKPYLTINNAAGQTDEGDTIFVWPGTYNETPNVSYGLIGPGVQLHCMPGAIVNLLSGALFWDTYDTDTLDARITGHGEFYIASGATLLKRTMTGSASAEIHCRKILTVGSGTIINADSGGVLNVKIKCTESMVGGATSNLFSVVHVDSIIRLEAPLISVPANGGQLSFGSGLSVGAGRVDIIADRLYATVTNDGIGECHIKAGSILSNGNGQYPLRSQSGKMFVDCDECTCSDADTNAAATSYLGELHLLRGRYKGSNGAAAGHAVYGIGASPIFVYGGAALIAGNHASAKSIANLDTGTPMPVKIMGHVVANKALGTAVSTIIGTYTVSASVT